MADEVAPLGHGTSGGARLGADGLVERHAGPWTPAVHAWLRHLRARGEQHVPVVVGVDGEVERQRRLPGAPGWHPPHGALRTDDGLRQLAAFVDRCHLASAGFDPPVDVVWASGRVGGPGAGEVVVHGDLGPWNTLWSEDRFAGVVDWDLAEPAPAWWDVANVVWGHVPVTPLPRDGQVRPGDGAARTDGWTPDQPRRLAVLGEAFGRTPAELLTVVADWLDLQLARRTVAVPAGPLWQDLAARPHDVAGLRVQRRWLDGGPGPAG